VSSLIQPAAVVALANARVRDAREALERKLDATTVNAPSGGVGRSTFGDTERRVLGLVRAASDILGGTDPVGLDPTSPLAPGPSRFAVLGSAGFEIAMFTDLFADGGPWRSDVLRRGTRDPNWSRVAVPSTAFPNAFGQAVRTESDASVRARGEAITLGMFAAVAHGVVMGPVARGAQARISNQEWNRHRPGPFVAAVDDKVLKRLFGSPDPIALWNASWPTAAQAAPYWKAYVDALESTYQLQDPSPRRRGFASFEHGLPPTPPVDVDRVTTGYERMMSGITPWGPGPWFGVLTPLLLAPSLATLLARVLPHANRFNTTDSLTDRSFSELITLADGLGSVTPFIYSMVMWSNVPDHSEAFWNALALFLARVGLVAGWIPTIGSADDDPSPAARWAIVGALLGADLYSMIRAIVATGGREPGAAAVFTMQTIPAMTSVAALIQAAIIKGIVEAAGPDGEDEASWITWIVTTLGLWFGVGLPAAFSLAGSHWLSWFTARSHEPHARSHTSIVAPVVTPVVPPTEPVAPPTEPLAVITEPTALAHVFDDSTLWFDPAVSTPGYADVNYPSGMRALVRIWWTGTEPLEVAHDGNEVRLRTGGTTTAVQIGPGARTASSIVAALVSAFPTDLHAEPPAVDGAADPDPDYDLPWPSTFADPGDDLATHAAHAAAAGAFVTVGDSRERAVVIRHAPRSTLATSFSLSEPTASPLRGVRVVPQSGLGDIDDTALGTAADLAVLLCLGGASRLRDVTPAQPNPPVPPALADLEPLTQVFRQWNLDERRVNEWREIVTGGASPEAALAGTPLAPGAPDGRGIALAMGWVPLWRAWLRVASDTAADTTAATAMSYTPTVTANDGRRFRPTNAELTAGIGHLLDLHA